MRRRWRVAKTRFLAVWNSDRPGASLLKDVVIAGLAVALLLGGVWLYTGQPAGTAPLVVVESNSMGHPDPPYGRLGTIDPGDLVLVKRVDARGDVETYFQDGERRYGKPGDVVVYRPGGHRDTTPIIHRAMAYVVVTCGDGEESRDGCRGDAENRTFTIVELGIFDAESLDLPELGLTNYRPLQSGFLTQGDNPFSNPSADQATSISPQPVRVEWLVGVARGELPWFGLIKLALFGNTAQPSADWCRVLAATAPCDAWVMLGVSLAVLVAVPIGADALKSYRARRRTR